MILIIRCRIVYVHTQNIIKKVYILIYRIIKDKFIILKIKTMIYLLNNRYIIELFIMLIISIITIWLFYYILLKLDSTK